jgi:ABC-type multidrug transport system fused ATPase/permease subunit
MRFGKVASRLISFISKSRAEMIDIYLDMFNTMTMLRNLNKKNYFKKEFYRKTDEYQIATTCLGNHSMRWLNIRISLFSLMAIISILGLPLLSKMYLSEYYLTQNWQFSYATNVGPFLIASILNFSRYFPQLTMNLISAQRIYYYIFESIDKLDKRGTDLINI